MCYRFVCIVADFGACLFVEELLAAADDDDDTEDHQKECDDQLETFNKEDSCAGKHYSIRGFIATKRKRKK